MCFQIKLLTPLSLTPFYHINLKQIYTIISPLSSSPSDHVIKLLEECIGQLCKCLAFNSFNSVCLYSDLFLEFKINFSSACYRSNIYFLISCTNSEQESQKNIFEQQKLKQVSYNVQNYRHCNYTLTIHGKCNTVSFMKQNFKEVY